MEGNRGDTVPVPSASDSAFSKGYAGIEGSGNASRSKNFKAGNLLGGGLTSTPLLDKLETAGPLSSNWSKTTWAPNIGSVWMGGYHGYGSPGGVAGAYWSAKFFTAENSGRRCPRPSARGPRPPENTPLLAGHAKPGHWAKRV